MDSELNFGIEQEKGGFDVAFLISGLANKFEITCLETLTLYFTYYITSGRALFDSETFFG